MRPGSLKGVVSAQKALQRSQTDFKRRKELRRMGCFPDGRSLVCPPGKNIHCCHRINSALPFAFRTEVAIRSVNGTMIVWLQNDAGYTRWGPTEDRVEQLLESFRPGRERERDKAQLLSPNRDQPASSSSSGMFS